MDLWKGFQKLDACHKAEWGPGPPRPSKNGSTAAPSGVSARSVPWSDIRLVLLYALAWCFASFVLAAAVTGLYQLIVWVGGI